LLVRDNDTRDTPAALFAELEALYGRTFRIDVCANHSNTKVPDCYYTLDGLASYGLQKARFVGLNGLTGRWATDWFCNPPFSEIGAWVKKAWAEGKPGLMVVPNSKAEQPWWQEQIEPYRDGRGRQNPRGTDLTTHYLPTRRRFLKDGAPILSKKTGKIGSPGFGLVALIWR
jgi:hypothetical protein